MILNIWIAPAGLYDALTAKIDCTLVEISMTMVVAEPGARWTSAAHPPGPVTSEAHTRIVAGVAGRVVNTTEILVTGAGASSVVKGTTNWP